MASTNKKPTPKAASKKNNNLILVAITAVVICLSVVILVNGKSAKSDTTNPTVENSEQTNEGATVVASGEFLNIPTADITTDASFYTVEVDGTQMEIIAVRDSNGEIRTAFNTCQICYASGKGYYKQSGNYLVCQNCGNRFSMDQVGIESGGCNPWPIFAANRTDTDDTISISYDFLTASKKIFANWKTNY